MYWISFAFTCENNSSPQTTLGVLLKGLLTDLCAHNFVHVQISLGAHWAHALYSAHNLSSPSYWFYLAVISTSISPIISWKLNMKINILETYKKAN